MFTQQDLKLLQEKGISRTRVETQLERFKNGFPYLSIVAAASIGNGLMKIQAHEESEYLSAWQTALKEGKTVTKFVPASGAASRMFKDLYAFLDADYAEPTTAFEKTFFDQIRQFAFYKTLDDKCVKLHGQGVAGLCAEGKHKEVVAALLQPEGLNYGNLPKGLLLFHAYPEGNRTPLGEHITEGALYAKDKNGRVNLHFTVSEEHQQLFELLVAARKVNYEQKLGAVISVTYSIQKPKTDTLAVNMNNAPFRDDEGNLVFRPGGHGALIENLNEIDSDVVFIKNIDNVVPDRLKEDESRYKKLLGGILVSMQKRAFSYLEKLHSPDITTEELAQMVAFVEDELYITPPEKYANEVELKTFLQEKLNRPFRVCGMVKNVGEPGGGPFIAFNPDGSSSPQILESPQIDKKNERAMTAFKNGSHFNPVDIVCGVKNWQGEKFDLTRYVDADTGFISFKSKDGKELKALELPGLWNGAMSDWNTIFVEVPISTFNPVKTVNDLLRPEHQ